MKETKQFGQAADEAPNTRADERWTRRRLFGSALCASLSISSASVAAQQIHVGPNDCEAGVRLTVKGARLSDVLKRLSETLGFQLQFEGRSDPVINIDIARKAPELVARLSPSDSMMVTQALDPRCPRQYRIVKVWVLPSANASAATPAQASSRAATPVAAAPPPLTPSKLDEMSRKAKEMYDEYIRINGVPPPTPEEEAAK